MRTEEERKDAEEKGRCRKWRRKEEKMRGKKDDKEEWMGRKGGDEKKVKDQRRREGNSRNEVERIKEREEEGGE